MLRDIFSSTNKVIIGAAFFLLIFAVGCYWYYQHTTAEYKQETKEVDQPLKQWEDHKKAKPPVETALPQASAEDQNTTADKPINETTPVTQKTETTQAQINPSVQTTEIKDVPVSPFGFGPYPKVPDDYIIPPDKFKWEFWGKTVKGELMSRVRIKLWRQGVKSDGASFQNGKVYPTILGTVYVQWSENGEFIRRMTGHPDDDLDAIEAALEAGQPSPEGITVLNRNEAGIDPYSFLELNKKE